MGRCLRFIGLASALPACGGASEPATDVPPGFVRIEPGVFTMGSPADEHGGCWRQTQHPVTLTRAFAVKATEVTQAEWQAVMGSNPSGFVDCGGDCPVENVNWNDAVDYCNALSAQQGLAPCYDAARSFSGFACEGYRLPTEAEWEYAARAGTQTALSTGDIAHPECRPLDPNLDAAGWYCGNSGETTHPVGAKQANAWGLYDMHGNVWEWVQDWDGAVREDAALDPLGPADGFSRGVRGGAWDRDARDACSAARGGDTLEDRNDTIGFRPVRTLP